MSDRAEASVFTGVRAAFLSGHPPTQTTAGTGGGGAVTLEAVRKAARMLKGPVSKDWLLVSPEGLVYKGEAGDVLSVLLHEHPLFKERKI